MSLDDVEKIQPEQHFKGEHDAEAALRASLDLFRTIVDNSTDLIGLFDAEGNVLYISPSVKNLLGYDPEALIGKSGWMFAPPERLVQGQAEVNAIKKGTGGPLVRQAELVKADGSRRRMEIRLRALGPEHPVQGVLLQARDLEIDRQSEELFRTVVENSLAMRQAGARTICQDEESSVVYGMPKEAWALGAAERQLSLEDIATALRGLLKKIPVRA